MAVYHKGLKYHKDETEKHEITGEELEFLYNLQKEMNTQDHVSQADPRFWVIKGSEKLHRVECEEDGIELYDEYEAIPYKIIPKIYEDTMFLTQKAAEEHLRGNSHHYSEDAHTYAMTAWRSPDVDKLWKILQTVDFSFAGKE
jgi:hypothetical protein